METSTVLTTTNANDTSHDWTGATIERVYYAVRDTHYTEGTIFDDRDKAIEYARMRSREAHARNAEYLAQGLTGGIVTAIQVDVRAFIRFVPGHAIAEGTDTPVDKFDIDAVRFDSTLKPTEKRYGWGKMGQNQ